MARTLLAARLWHEGNSFSPVLTQLADFQRYEWHQREAAEKAYRNTRSEMGAAVDFAQQPGWNVHFSRCAAAAPCGPVAKGLFALIRDTILADIARVKPDAIYLSLHGALLCEDVERPDLALLRAVRKAAPDTPIGVSFDLHANLHPDMAACADIMSAYATYPHEDMYETAGRVLRLLDDTVAGTIKPHCAIIPLGRILPSHNMRTDKGPMADVQAKLRQFEREGQDVLALSALGGFAYADVPHAGASGLACVNGGAQQAGAWARKVTDGLARQAPRFFVTLPEAKQGLAEALQLIETKRWPVALIDPADNPMSGGLGDTTTLFAALLNTPVAVPTVFAFFFDPELVARAQAAGVGATLEVRLGGRLLPQFSQPVAWQGMVERITDGRFVSHGPMWAGQAFDIGPSVVLRDPKRPLRVIVTSACQSPNDMAWCELHGIDLEKVALFCVKAKNHFRAAFGPRCGAIIEVDTPGVASLNLEHLPYRHVPLALRQAA